MPLKGEINLDIVSKLKEELHQSKNGNIKLENLPQEELIIVMQGGGTARMLSASFTENTNNQISEQNLQFDIDTVNNKLIIVKDADTGHKIAERTITENGKFKVAGYDLKLNGEAKLKDSFKITDNFTFYF